MLALLTACAGAPRNAATYTVKRGDTLYSIATRRGLDYRDVARWNGLDRNYTIVPGQVLRLAPPSGGRAVVRNAPAAKSRPVTRPPAQPIGPPVKWQWPVEGGSVTLTQRPNGGQGLTIGGRSGQEVRAAGSGRVVYTGTGLLGYGQLVIIKHNETYLSAYGHTQSVMVHEGDTVRAGQHIASMGNGPQGAPMLYFEIRVNGDPNNPLTFLPKQR